MTYRIVPCPKCNRMHGVVAVNRVRASRSAAHLVSDSALGARERDGARSSEAPERVAVVSASARHDGASPSRPVAAQPPLPVKPMPVHSRRRLARALAGGG